MTNEVSLYFDSQVHAYENLNKNLIWKKIKKNEIEALIPKKFIFKNKKVLDLGCGNGIYTNLIFQGGAELIDCVDISSKMLESLVSNSSNNSNSNSNSNSKTKIRTFCTQIENFKPDIKYDVMILSGSFEFLKHHQNVLNLISTYMQPGGLLLILAPRKNFLGGLYYLFHLYHGIRVKLFSIKELKKMALKSDFCIDKVENIFPFALVMHLKKCENQNTLYE